MKTYHEPAREILHHVSFEIPAGRTVAVVGPSGSGKSTLARLLYRFYDVQQGRITIVGPPSEMPVFASHRVNSRSSSHTMCRWRPTLNSWNAALALAKSDRFNC